ncbi:MAG TPA: NADH-quinone oxidoreductase subunit L [Ornithinicoccus sp.]|nr:NADH-quinone oxidoreductase subunit L [Ornithinicoccus sp.]
MSSLRWPDTIPVPDISLPLPPLPDLPLPDLPGTATHWVVALPAVAALAGLVLVRRSSRAAAWVAVGAAALTLLASLVQAHAVTRAGGRALTAPTFGPLPFGELAVPLELVTGRLTALVAVVVGVVALVIQVFARWYLWYDPRYRSFAATVSLFTAAMMLVVHSDDVLLTLVGWEVMGWCSFLLIGHLSVKESANRAATKALLVTRLADVGMVLGLVALAVHAGTTSISAIVHRWLVVSVDGLVVALRGDVALPLTVAMVLVVLGVAGKSAQLPFQDWLPDAMEGPTPASALIHAATMVAAGTVVLAQLFPLLQAAPAAKTLLAVLVAVTTVGASLLAFAQPDLKRLLAWSTVSQVGLMLAGLTVVPNGLGPDAAIMHLGSHAAYKALLFLTLGWLAVLAGGTAVAYVVSGVRRYPTVRRPMALGLLALAGVPPTVGFVSKEMLLSQAEAGVAADPGLAPTLVLAAIGATVPLTAAYCMRAWLIMSRPRPVAPVDPGSDRPLDQIFGEPEVVAEAIGVEEAESAISSSARAGISVLAALTLLGGLLAFTAVIEVDLHVNLEVVAASLGLMLAAAVAVWGASRGVPSRDAAARLPAAVGLAAERGLWMDRAHHHLVVRPVLWLARGVAWLDHEVLDFYVRGAGRAATLLGGVGERTRVRRVAPALVWVLAGTVVLSAVGVVLG